jgi:hypothetical protein
MWEFPPFRLDTVNQCLWRREDKEDERISLTPKAFAMLNYLVEHPGRLIVIAVTRAGEPRLDARDLTGQEGDVLHLAVLDDSLRELDEALARGKQSDAGS